MATEQMQETMSIANRAMKFKLSRGGTARRVRDKDAEALVKQTLGDEGQIVSRETFKDKGNAVAQYQQLSNEMHAYHIKATLPFGDDSSRVLPNAAYFTYTTKIGDFISRLSVLRINILANWDGLVNADIAARNYSLVANGKSPTAKVEDYPTAKQMENKLYVVWYPEPVSTSGDFRFTLPPEMLAVVDKQYAEMVEAASRERFTRMLTPVSAFIKKLGEFKGDKGQRWHDSFVENIAALPDEINALNIVDNPDVDAFLAEISTLIKPYVAQPDALKEDVYAREEMKKKLQTLEDSLKGYAF